MKRHIRIFIFALLFVFVIAGNVNALAAESIVDFNLASLMQAGIDGIKDDIFKTLLLVVPILLSITGAVVAINFGIKYLKKLGGSDDWDWRDDYDYYNRG